jgi:hypothetical protein
MGAAVGLVTKALAPSVGGLVGSIVGDIGSKVVSGAAGGALGGILNPFDIVKNIGTAFENIFGKKQPTRHQHTCPPLPLPFSPPPGFPLGNPVGVLKDVGATLESLVAQMQKLLSGQQGSAPSISRPSTSVASTGGGTAGAAVASGGKVDELMAEANRILKDPNASESEKLRAQELMSQANNLFQFLSKIIQMVNEMFRSVTNALSGR